MPKCKFKFMQNKMKNRVVVSKKEVEVLTNAFLIFLFINKNKSAKKPERKPNNIRLKINKGWESVSYNII